MLVQDVEALRSVAKHVTANIESIGNEGERAIARVTMPAAVIAEGLDVDTIVENLNYFLFIGVDAFRALIKLSQVLQDLGAPYQIRELYEPREEEQEKRGVYIYIEEVNPLIPLMIEGFMRAMVENGTDVEFGTAVAVTEEGDEVDHTFIFFPERHAFVPNTDVMDAIAEVEAIMTSVDLDVTCPISLANYMRAATSEADWNKRADDVKAANGGEYPSIWFITIIVMGVLNQARQANNW